MGSPHVPPSPASTLPVPPHGSHLLLGSLSQVPQAGGHAHQALLKSCHQVGLGETGMWMSTRDPELLGTGWGAQRGDFSWGRGASTRGKPTAGTTAGWPRGAPKGTQISRGWAPAPHIPRGFPQGLTLADSWDVRVATFSCEDSSSRRSLRICCGERTKRGRGGERGRGARLGCGSEVGTRRQRWARAHLGLHLLLSLAARGQRETDRGGQSGGQRGTAKAQRGAEDMHRAPPYAQLSAPNPTQAPPQPTAMQEAAQPGGGSYGGVGGGGAGGQGQHRSVNCNRTKAVRKPGAPGATGGSAGTLRGPGEGGCRALPAPRHLATTTSW